MMDSDEDKENLYDVPKNLRHCSVSSPEMLLHSTLDEQKLLAHEIRLVSRLQHQMLTANSEERKILKEKLDNIKSIQNNSDVFKIHKKDSSSLLNTKNFSRYNDSSIVDEVFYKEDETAAKLDDFFNNAYIDMPNKNELNVSDLNFKTIDEFYKDNKLCINKDYLNDKFIEGVNKAESCSFDLENEANDERFTIKQEELNVSNGSISATNMLNIQKNNTKLFETKLCKQEKNFDNVPINIQSCLSTKILKVKLDPKNIIDSLEINSSLENSKSFTDASTHQREPMYLSKNILLYENLFKENQKKDSSNLDSHKMQLDQDSFKENMDMVSSKFQNVSSHYVNIKSEPDARKINSSNLLLPDDSFMHKHKLNISDEHKEHPEIENHLSKNSLSHSLSSSSDSLSESFKENINKLKLICLDPTSNYSDNLSKQTSNLESERILAHYYHRLSTIEEGSSFLSTQSENKTDCKSKSLNDLSSKTGERSNPKSNLKENELSKEMSILNDETHMNINKLSPKYASSDYIILEKFSRGSDFLSRFYSLKKTKTFLEPLLNEDKSINENQIGADEIVNSLHPDSGIMQDILPNDPNERKINNDSNDSKNCLIESGLGNSPLSTSTNSSAYNDSKLYDRKLHRRYMNLSLLEIVENEEKMNNLNELAYNKDYEFSDKKFNNFHSNLTHLSPLSNENKIKSNSLQNKEKIIPVWDVNVFSPPNNHITNCPNLKEVKTYYQPVALLSSNEESKNSTLQQRNIMEDLYNEPGILEEPDLTLIDFTLASTKVAETFNEFIPCKENGISNVKETMQIPEKSPLSESMRSFLRHELSSLKAINERVSLLPPPNIYNTKERNIPSFNSAAIQNKPDSAKKPQRDNYKSRTKRLWNNLEEVRKKKNEEEMKKALALQRLKAKEYGRKTPKKTKYK